MFDFALLLSGVGVAALGFVGNQILRALGWWKGP